MDESVEADLDIIRNVLQSRKVLEYVHINFLKYLLTTKYKGSKWRVDFVVLELEGMFQLNLPYKLSDHDQTILGGISTEVCFPNLFNFLVFCNLKVFILLLVNYIKGLNPWSSCFILALRKHIWCSKRLCPLSRLKFSSLQEDKNRWQWAAIPSLGISSEDSSSLSQNAYSICCSSSG